jgi:hypothetical protein
MLQNKLPNEEVNFTELPPSVSVHSFCVQSSQRHYVDDFQLRLKSLYSVHACCYTGPKYPKYSVLPNPTRCSVVSATKV